MAARYTAIPAIPQTGINEWQAQLLASIKENVELLTGTRGEIDRASEALNKSSLTVGTPPAQSMTRVTAGGNGITLPTGFSIDQVSGNNYEVNITGRTNVPLLEDYVRLVTNVQTLANDVATLRQVVAVLITQLKG